MCHEDTSDRALLSPQRYVWTAENFQKNTNTFVAGHECSCCICSKCLYKLSTLYIETTEESITCNDVSPPSSSTQNMLLFIFKWLRTALETDRQIRTDAKPLAVKQLCALCAAQIFADAPHQCGRSLWESNVNSYEKIVCTQRYTDTYTRKPVAPHVKWLAFYQKIVGFWQQTVCFGVATTELPSGTSTSFTELL